MVAEHASVASAKATGSSHSFCLPNFAIVQSFCGHHFDNLNNT